MNRPGQPKEPTLISKATIQLASDSDTAITLATDSSDTGAIVRRFLDDLAMGPPHQFDATGRVLLPDVEVNRGEGSLDDFIDQLSDYQENFFALEMGVKDFLVDDDRVAVRIGWKGRSYVEHSEYAPTEAEVEWTDFAIFRVLQGQVQEYWGNSGLSQGKYQALVPNGVPESKLATLQFAAPWDPQDPYAATLTGLVKMQQELLEAKDRQIDELHHLVDQIQTALIAQQRTQKKQSWWRRLLSR